MADTRRQKQPDGNFELESVSKLTGIASRVTAGVTGHGELCNRSGSENKFAPARATLRRTTVAGYYLIELKCVTTLASHAFDHRSNRGNPLPILALIFLIYCFGTPQRLSERTHSASELQLSHGRFSK